MIDFLGLIHHTKSKLAQHAYEEGHKICWKEAKGLQIEPNTTYRKYKESDHISLVAHPVTPPIWTPNIEEEVEYYNSIQFN
jgi:hypothetical protein